MISLGLSHMDRHTGPLDKDTLIATEGEPCEALGRGQL